MFLAAILDWGSYTLFEKCEAVFILGWLLFFAYHIIDYYIRRDFVEDLPKKYVLVTGCDSGFGNKLAKQLDTMGVHVFATCLTEKGRLDLEYSTSSRLRAIHMDICNQASIRKVFEIVKNTTSASEGLWGLVNNAGIAGRLGPLEMLRNEDYISVFNVNMLGMVNVTNAFLPLIKKARGRVVNTASFLGRIGMPEGVPYCISKFGVECYSDALRLQLAPFGVSVLIIEPGAYKTSMFSPEDLGNQVQAVFDRSSPELKAEYGQVFVDDAKKRIKGTYIFATHNTSPVVNGYIHALFSTNPKKRYSCGLFVKFLYIPLSYAPSCVQDYVQGTIFPWPVPESCRNGQ